MIKSFIFFMLLFWPMLMNFIMILIMMMPSKLTNFNPMTYMLLLITLTFLISIKINYIFKSWISFILFLTMIGGLMIIFLYIISLSSNQLFFMNYLMIFINFLKISLMLIFLMMMMMFFYNSMNLNLMNYENLLMLDQMNLNFFYKKFYYYSTIFMMFYLFYSMIIIMNICFKFKSPLRQIKF